jgi:hypothetical protein|tara:strand:- start:1244 stop:1459 length:216 start_codon:yes stop_codon:yes gene_type:complete
MARPNKLSNDFSAYVLRMSTKDLKDIKKLSRKLSDDTDTQISIADVMRYCIINHKKDAENYFKETRYAQKE